VLARSLNEYMYNVQPLLKLFHNNCSGLRFSARSVSVYIRGRHSKTSEKEGKESQTKSKVMFWNNTEHNLIRSSGLLL
jgi:hypothetical protein